ncbi:Na/Pi symporter [Thalassovita sp.]|uniref:Na/Pi cotransporter family protein n=1 Tax=Thalassovita sp. TaxID=1979401 RepID=UPI0029DE6F44|nr:Na/Pi symporter [Thalassovita sp.]
MTTTTDLLAAIGGIGMFLLGMETMTAALRALAGGSLRQLLARVTTSPLKGVLTGAGVTAVIQSSSATTVMTVGFVGAGLLTLHQAIGILLGANIGTTATGWLVTLLGFKLALGKVAMVTLLPATLAMLLGRGKLERAGRLLAGLSLLLIGLEMMQDGVSDTTGLLTPEMIPSGGIWGGLLLIVIGLVVTVVIQSSSAAVALALVLLSSGAITVLQAAMMVVGMNIGTTFTAILASLGGSRVMRQTALANLVFNLVTALLALPILWLGHSLLEDVAVTAGPLTALLVFHTGFNVVGAAVFLPFTSLLVTLVQKWVPDPDGSALIHLDPALLKDSATALVAAQAATRQMMERLFGAIAKGMGPEPDYRTLSSLGISLPPALDELGEYLTKIGAAQDPDPPVYSALLHALDHLRRLSTRAQQTANLPVLKEDRALRRPALILSEMLRRTGVDGMDTLDAARLRRLELLLEKRAREHRRGMLLGEHAGLYGMRDVFQHTDAMRWLQRVLHHVQRLSEYDRIAAPVRRDRAAKPDPEV